MRKYDPPEVTLSALAETGLDGSTLPVLNQRTYTGRKVIPSTLADTPCADLDVHGVLEKLNTIRGTSYILSPTVSSVLESYIRRNWDFGTVYAHLRFYWMLRRDEENDREMRKSAIVGNRITRRGVVPRRIWDLYANRVVPYWVALERLNVMTPINGYEWPVPIPNDANLNLIRIETLNFWSRVCLVGFIREDLRREEWKLDVPTIGYAWICYLSGLGRPMNFKRGVFEGDRSWFNRAFMEEEIQARLSEMRLSRVTFNMLLQMQSRRSIPIYDAAQSEEDALDRSSWMPCHSPNRADLFFYYPGPGDRNKSWRPSWKQVMAHTIPVVTEEVDSDWGLCSSRMARGDHVHAKSLYRHTVPDTRLVGIHS
ncbi:hypothetical protein IW261DRAFT_1481286 [Armillaria novae-zelandiae]|uniref:Uncharacterized protein n=1 Tax=Armillaria novae-zelandiae TaxID=153914 RepID=A0AA39UHB5_9AGAR|nr:hypothetical protein IW261DRAFT_1481286 [Armillaria novae-zelandiae]